MSFLFLPPPEPSWLPPPVPPPLPSPPPPPPPPPLADGSTTIWRSPEPWAWELIGAAAMMTKAAAAVRSVVLSTALSPFEGVFPKTRRVQDRVIGYINQAERIRRTAFSRRSESILDGVGAPSPPRPGS